METGISINKYIYSILNNDEELKKLVGKNIYPLIAEEGATFPFIIYKKNSISTEYTKDSRVYDNVEFTIIVVANQYVDSVNVAERVRGLIESRNDEHFKDTRLSNINEDYTDDSYIQELTFSTIVR